MYYTTLTIDDMSEIWVHDFTVVVVVCFLFFIWYDMNM